MTPRPGALRRKSKRRKALLAKKILDKERERAFEKVKQWFSEWKDPFTNDFLPAQQQALLARICRQEIRKLFLAAEPRIQFSKYDVMPFLIGLPKDIEECFDRVLEQFTQYRSKLTDAAKEEADQFVREYFGYWRDRTGRIGTDLLEASKRSSLLSVCLDTIRMSVEVNIGKIPCGTHKHGKNLDLMKFSSIRTHTEKLLDACLNGHFEEHPIPLIRSIDDAFE